MRFCLFPNAAELKERLGARFRPSSPASIKAAKKEVADALAEDLSDSTKARAAVTAMRSAIATLESGHADGRVDYLRAVTDLQVSKGSGLLAFTGIVAATAGIGLEKLESHFVALVLCLSSAAAALFASLIVLFVVWSSSPSQEEFRTAEDESLWLTTLLARRAWKLNLAVVLGILATALLVATGVARLVGTAESAQSPLKQPGPAASGVPIAPPSSQVQRPKQPAVK